ncbi:Choline/Carnitine o-acyltransferase [Rivularia sp. PCC 7116]|nr:Choline/Carnitine o-acyltransferase [Rivularia sp. PCC 7116]
MYEFQNSLPKLPLPTLEQTCKLYLQIVAPLLSQQELKETQVAVEEFQQTSGKKLQQQLEIINRATKTSYVHDYREESFSEYRGALAIHKNFGGVLAPISQPELPQAQLAATWIVDTLKFYLKIKRRELEPDRDSPRNGNQPMCMIQYDNLFAWNRIPGVKRDEMRHIPEQENIVVVYRNAFYSLQPLKDEKIASLAEVEGQINWILENASANEPALGALTAMNRAAWAVVRQGMTALDPGNARSFDLLDSALFVVCLDDTAPANLEAAGGSVLHGDGKNRCFDKPLQLIFTSNGYSGVNVEHVGIDGFVIMRYLYEVNKERQQQQESAQNTNAAFELETPTKLQWKFSDEILAEIKQAELEVENFISEHETKVFDYQEFGRNLIKNYRLSPDAVVQLAIQLAYVKLRGRIDCVYESVHTRRFAYGRTEAMRSVTPESVELIRTFTEKSADEEKYAALNEAVAAHVSRQKDCQQGYGVDRHLQSLLRLGRAQGIVPKIYQDKAYKVLGDSTICTSSLAAGMGMELFCFGQVVDNGYGIGYIIKPDSITVSVTSKYQQTQEYLDCLKQSFSELGELMSKFGS